jgi:TetR/AcrR family transcriptional repressor of lmrAB and yxaGH operons
VKIVLATLDLLRRSGLSGAGINQVIDVSQAPKGSLYHYFPGGKEQLVTEALGEAARTIGDNFGAIFGGAATIGDKVRALFAKTAAGLEANEYLKGCPVAAVTLDLDRNSESLRKICKSVFDRWVDAIATGLKEVPERERIAVAHLVLATLEGGLILSRAHQAKEPLLHVGKTLAEVLERRHGRGRRVRRPRS